MAIEIIKPGAANVGSARFIVRAGRYMPLTDAAQLRVKYNEYPERVPLFPGFPRAGRRGPSRPASAQGIEPAQTPPGGAPPPGGGIPPDYNPDIYPPPRDRDGADNLPTNSNLPAPGAPGASATRNCAGSGGMHLQVGTAVATLTTDVRVSQRIDRPYIIRYVEVYSNATVAATMGVMVKVATDNNTAGGTNTTGVPLDESGFGGFDFQTEGQLHRSYPNKLVTTIGTYIKTIADNQTAGTIVYQVIISIEFLD